MPWAAGRPSAAPVPLPLSPHSAKVAELGAALGAVAAIAHPPESEHESARKLAESQMRAAERAAHRRAVVQQASEKLARVDKTMGKVAAATKIQARARGFLVRQRVRRRRREERQLQEEREKKRAAEEARKLEESRARAIARAEMRRNGATAKNLTAAANGKPREDQGQTWWSTLFQNR